MQAPSTPHRALLQPLVLPCPNSCSISQHGKLQWRWPPLFCSFSFWALGSEEFTQQARHWKSTTGLQRGITIYRTVWTRTVFVSPPGQLWAFQTKPELPFFRQLGGKKRQLLREPAACGREGAAVPEKCSRWSRRGAAEPARHLRIPARSPPQRKRVRKCAI